MKKSLARAIKEKKDESRTQKQVDKYKKTKLYKLTDSFMKDLKDLTVLDISENMLENVHIDAIFKGSNKLKSIYINSNLINLIPFSLSGLKLLVDFRHDWNILFKNKNEEKLEELKVLCCKPDKIVKIADVSGINFLTYCENIKKMEVNKRKEELGKMIKQSDCSIFAKEDMLNMIKIRQNPSENVRISSGQAKKVFDCNYACFNELFALTQSPKEEIKSKGEKKPCFSNIKISGIKTIKNNAAMEKETEINTTQDSFISISSSSQPVQNLHKVFSKFDDNIAENISKVDYLFKSGANPNMFDKNGRTIFHICVINNQIEGLKFLFSVNRSNPNFLDLETRTMNEGRNIFHLSCFLKNFQISKFLIASGFPLEKRDNLGNRAIHLIDQNLQFQSIIKKQTKKRNKQKVIFERHPLRYQQQSDLNIVEKKNNNLLAQYEAATNCQKKQFFFRQ